MSEFTKTLDIVPGYDHVEAADGSEHFGRSGADIVFRLDGPDGTVLWKVLTAWLPSYATYDADGVPLRPDFHRPLKTMRGRQDIFSEPTPGSVDFHWKLPYADLPVDGPCSYVGSVCYLSRWHLGGYPAMTALLTGGAEGVWEFLIWQYQNVGRGDDA